MGKFLIHLLTLVTLAFTLGLTMASCNTSGCTELRSATPRADFYSSSGSAISLDSISITGVGVKGDSTLVHAGQRVSQVYLPMPPVTDTVRWEIRYEWKVLSEFDITDIIEIVYERQPWFAGEECGAMYRYLIQNVSFTTNAIDSVVVVNPLVTNVDRPTLNIYFPFGTE